MSVMKEWMVGAVRQGLHRMGLEVRRTPPPPPLVEGPLEALRAHRSGRAYAFNCPVDKCISYNGFRHAEESWHPFSATLEARAEKKETGYQDSILKSYYERWRPRNAGEALIGCREIPDYLERVPSYAFLVPWHIVSAEQRSALVRDGIEHFIEGEQLLDTAVDHAYHVHGPVTEEFGRAEYRRLIGVFESIREAGYDRSHGDVVVSLYQRGSEFRFGIEHGNHRIAAMKALGHETIPARLVGPRLIMREEAACWPQVRLGQWDVESARAYFDHLFDFGARAWAIEQGIIPEERTPQESYSYSYTP